MTITSLTQDNISQICRFTWGQMERKMLLCLPRKQPSVNGLHAGREPQKGWNFGLGGELAPVKARVAADLKDLVDGARTPEACSILNARLASVASGIRSAREKKAWGEALVTIVSGHETYTTNAGDSKEAKELADPCAVQVYRLAGRKTPAQLRAAEERLKAEEAKRTAAQPLTLAEKARQDLSGPGKPAQGGAKR